MAREEGREPEIADLPGGGAIVAIAIAAVAVGALLARPLGRWIQPTPLRFWPEVLSSKVIRPEPTELVLYLVAVVAPLAIALVLLAARHHTGRTSRLSMRVVFSVAAAIAAIVVVVGWVERSEPLTYDLYPDYFSWLDLAVAVLAVGVVVALVRRTAARRRLAAASSHRLGGLVAAAVVLVTAVCLVAPNLYLDRGLGDAPPPTAFHLPYTHADFAAFGNGATPLVDYSSQYSNLLPWVLHPALALFDYAPGAFTFLLGGLSLLTLVAMWRSLTLVAGDEVRGAALTLPVIAVAMRSTLVFGHERLSNGSLFQIMPERYVLPLLVVWACVRHARGLAPRRSAWIFGLAGLAALNNPEFGVPCMVAAFGAVLVCREESLGAALRRVVPAALVGAGAALGVVVALTLLRTGAMPDPGHLTYFSRFYASQGFGMQSMPSVGFFWVVYATFVAALVAGVTASRRSARDRALAALLTYAGVFGLGAGTYYVGRSNAITLVGVFPAWGLALAALACLSLRWLSADEPRPAAWSPAAPLCVLALTGFALVATDLAEVPPPGEQVQRLRESSDVETPFDMGEEEEFLEDRTRPGDAVLILHENGHLLARRAGVRNTSSIAHPAHVMSREQLDELLTDLEKSGGRSVFIGPGHFSRAYRSLSSELVRRGWTRVATKPSNLAEWRRIDDPDP